MRSAPALIACQAQRTASVSLTYASYRGMPAPIRTLGAPLRT